MKKSIFLAVAAVAMTACSNDVDLGMKDANKQTADNAIGFEVRNSNMSRATTALESNNHYNFGVWAYKSTDNEHEIMANYLVGYFGASTNPYGYKKSGNQTTWGDANSNYDDLLSLWAYEGLGKDEYTHATNAANEHYYTTSSTGYLSNNAKQYLRYFDKSATYTYFYAYAPYIESATAVTFDNGSKIMTFPDKTIVDGYNDESKYEYLFAGATVENTAYEKDVQLNFKHLNSRIRIVFYEDIAGYQVNMEPLHANAGIIAVPTEYVSATSEYNYASNLMKKANVTINFTNIANPTVSAFNSDATYTGTKGEAIDANIGNKALVFRAPASDVMLTEDRAVAVNNYVPNQYYSADTYYGIPHDTSCGLTFRVSFKLTSTTGETILVKNAGVYVDASKCKWERGKNYTYIFKITKNANGSTESGETPTLDPNPGTKALFPIVFDGLTVVDWEDASDNETGSDHIINNN